MSDLSGKHLSEDDLAARWLIDPHTLQVWRKTGKGPRYRRIGERRVIYPLSEVEAYEVARTFCDNAEERLALKREATAAKAGGTLS